VARKKNPNPTAETLREIEASGDQVVEWASEHAALILGVLAGILVLAGGIGIYVQAGENARDEAANALAIATSQYRRAMGADPIGGPIPEPANPALGSATRTEYVERFEQVAIDHDATTAGALAWLEAGELQRELGQLDASAESFQNARSSAPGTAIDALGSVRLGLLSEERGEVAAAAAFYAAAAGITEFPLRSEALADAARCWVSAGQADQALAALQRLEAEFPDQTISPPIASLLAELRARPE
jgi:tetratricopeptide (TPR) repeat protein